MSRDGGQGGRQGGGQSGGHGKSPQPGTSSAALVSVPAGTPVRPPGFARAVPIALAAAAVLAQIAYPLTPQGPARDRLTVVSVVVFFLASVSHAWVWRGLRFAAMVVAVTAGGGLMVEALGVATGVPFGSYAYTDTLGRQLLGVPVVIPLAWTMMAYPALLVGRTIQPGMPWGPVVAGWALASWDLFLDPQMVDAGHWEWASSGVPTLLEVPLTNFAAWFAVATLMMAVLWRVPQRGVVLAEDPQQGGTRLGGTRPGGGRRITWTGWHDDRVPYALYLWAYGSSVMAHAVFFGLPASAVVGGIGMGIVVVAFLAALRRRGRQP